MQRNIAIDLARFLAIVGMMAAHLLVFPTGSDLLNLVTDGFPSTLFAVLGGFGVVFSTRRYLREGRVTSAVVAVLARGLVVVGVGLALELLPPHPIAVVLVYYGFAIMVGSVLVLLPQLPLAILTAALALGSPLLLESVRSAAYVYVAPGDLSYDSPWKFLLSVALTGTYPALTWTVYLAVGILMARFVLRPSARTNVRAAALALGAGVVAFAIGEGSTARRIAAIAPQLAADNGLGEDEVVSYLRSAQYGGPFSGGWDAILLGSPHSGTTADILRTGGAAVALIAVLLLLFSATRKTPLILKPLVRAGGAPLTVYVLHIAMTSLSIWGYNQFVGPGSLWDAQRESTFMAASFWWQLAVILTLGIYLSFANKRGPLERVTSHVSRWAAGLASAGALASGTGAG